METFGCESTETKHVWQWLVNITCFLHLCFILHHMPLMKRTNIVTGVPVMSKLMDTTHERHTHTHHPFLCFIILTVCGVHDSDDGLLQFTQHKYTYLDSPLRICMLAYNFPSQVLIYIYIIKTGYFSLNHNFVY